MRMPHLLFWPRKGQPGNTSEWVLISALLLAVMLKKCFVSEEFVSFGKLAIGEK